MEEYLRKNCKLLIELRPSIAPNAASPMIGHGVAPLEPPVSLIDFHGQRDKIIPFDADKLGSKARALISEIK